MTRKKSSTLQVLRPDLDAKEQRLREQFIHVTIDVGTPWDPPGQRLQYKAQIPRMVFEMAKYGAIEAEVTQAVQQIENAIRYELMPNAAAATE